MKVTSYNDIYERQAFDPSTALYRWLTRVPGARAEHDKHQQPKEGR